jgi:hypothetical protein
MSGSNDQRGIGDVEHVAACAADGPLLVYVFSPAHDWQVVNVSQKTGAKIVAPPGPAWVVGDVEHVAACAADGSLLVYVFSPAHDWQVVNVSQKTGAKTVGPPNSSWLV